MASALRALKVAGTTRFAPGRAKSGQGLVVLGSFVSVYQREESRDPIGREDRTLREGLLEDGPLAVEAARGVDALGPGTSTGSKAFYPRL